MAPYHVDDPSTEPQVGDQGYVGSGLPAPTIGREEDADVVGGSRVLYLGARDAIERNRITQAWQRAGVKFRKSARVPDAYDLATGADYNKARVYLDVADGGEVDNPPARAGGRSLPLPKYDVNRYAADSASDDMGTVFPILTPDVPSLVLEAISSVMREDGIALRRTARYPLTEAKQRVDAYDNRDEWEAAAVAAGALPSGFEGKKIVTAYTQRADIVGRWYPARGSGWVVRKQPQVPRIGEANDRIGYGASIQSKSKRGQSGVVRSMNSDGSAHVDFYDFDRTLTKDQLADYEVVGWVDEAALRRFVVTVTPKLTVHTGSHRSGEYTVTVSAASAADAVKRARSDWADENGRMSGGATFKARLARDDDAVDEAAVDSPEFMQWFGASKVVDAEGKPLRVYHGTAIEKTQFRRDRSSDMAGIYFTADADEASDHAGMDASIDGEPAHVYAVYLSIKNPKILSGRESHVFTQEQRDQWESEGYDGVFGTHAGKVFEYVAFRPEQIKSATGNKGSFSSDDPDIAETGPDNDITFDGDPEGALEPNVAPDPGAIGLKSAADDVHLGDLLQQKGWAEDEPGNWSCPEHPDLAISYPYAANTDEPDTAALVSAADGAEVLVTFSNENEWRSNVEPLLGGETLLLDDPVEEAQNQIGLWRYNTVTGYWKLERMCDTDTAEQWLAQFQKDEPDAKFKLSKKKPTSEALSLRTNHGQRDEAKRGSTPNMPKGTSDQGGAYRGYLIQPSLTGREFFVSKGGAHIAAYPTLDAAKKGVDELHDLGLAESVLIRAVDMIDEVGERVHRAGTEHPEWVIRDKANGVVLKDIGFSSEHEAQRWADIVHVTPDFEIVKQESVAGWAHVLSELVDLSGRTNKVAVFNALRQSGIERGKAASIAHAMLGSAYNSRQDLATLFRSNGVSLDQALAAMRLLSPAKKQGEAAGNKPSVWARDMNDPHDWSISKGELDSFADADRCPECSRKIRQQDFRKDSNGEFRGSCPGCNASLSIINDDESYEEAAGDAWWIVDINTGYFISGPYSRDEATKAYNQMSTKDKVRAGLWYGTRSPENFDPGPQDEALPDTLDAMHNKPVTGVAVMREAKKGDKMRDQERPTVFGHELDRDTLTPKHTPIDVHKPGDYGADPVGDGTFRMVPSGDIVDFDERNRRLSKRESYYVHNDVVILAGPFDGSSDANGYKGMFGDDAKVCQGGSLPKELKLLLGNPDDCPLDADTITKIESASPFGQNTGEMFKVTYPNNYEGEVVEKLMDAPSGHFAIYLTRNGAEISMHESDVEPYDEDNDDSEVDPSEFDEMAEDTGKVLDYSYGGDTATYVPTADPDKDFIYFADMTGAGSYVEFTANGQVVATVDIDEHQGLRSREMKDAFREWLTAVGCTDVAAAEREFGLIGISQMQYFKSVNSGADYDDDDGEDDDSDDDGDDEFSSHLGEAVDSKLPAQYRKAKPGQRKQMDRNIARNIDPQGHAKAAYKARTRQLRGEAGDIINDFMQVRGGDRVYFTDRNGDAKSGRAQPLLTNPREGRIVLNMGGKHGTPQVVTPDNFVRAVRGSGGSRDQTAQANAGRTEAAYQVLWGTKDGDEEWQEQILSTNPERFDEIKKRAAADGFGRFRVSSGDDTKAPNFTATVRGGRRKLRESADTIGGSVERQQDYTQYVVNGPNHRITAPKFNPPVFKPSLESGIYTFTGNMDGSITFERKEIRTDEILRFEDSRYNEVLAEIDDFFSDELRERFHGLGFAHKRGALLYGIPGTGKSILCKQVIEKCVAKDMIVLVTERPYNLKEALHQIREIEETRNIVVILEDLDEFCQYNEHEMLQLMDGNDALDGVLVLGTTNYIEKLPPRILRPGRFDTKVEVGPPPEAGRRAYLKAKLQKIITGQEGEQLESDDAIEEIAKSTSGFTFAMLRELVVCMYCYKKSLHDAIERVTGRKPAEGGKSVFAGLGESTVANAVLFSMLSFDALIPADVHESLESVGKPFALLIESTFKVGDRVRMRGGDGTVMTVFDVSGRHVGVETGGGFDDWAIADDLELVNDQPATSEPTSEYAFSDPQMEGSNWFTVYLGNKAIDKVMHNSSDPDEVKRGLVNHDNYDPDIRVVKSRASQRRPSKPFGAHPESPGESADPRGQPPLGHPDRDSFDLGDGPDAKYRVFVRNWWRNPDMSDPADAAFGGGRVPHGGARKTTLRTGLSYADAVAVAKQYNDTHKPGKLSRKAELEREPVKQSRARRWRPSRPFGTGESALTSGQLAVLTEYRRSPVPVTEGHDDIRELELYITNDEKLTAPAIKHLQKKAKRGIYDPDLAVKTWKHIADTGAERYAHEFGSRGARGHQMFSPEDRRQVAVSLRKHYEDEVQGRDGAPDADAMSGDMMTRPGTKALPQGESKRGGKKDEVKEIDPDEFFLVNDRNEIVDGPFPDEAAAFKAKSAHASSGEMYAIKTGEQINMDDLGQQESDYETSRALTGSPVPLKPGEQHCPHCHGYGGLPINKQDPHMTRFAPERCPDCGGTGKSGQQEAGDVPCTDIKGNALKVGDRVKTSEGDGEVVDTGYDDEQGPWVSVELVPDPAYHPAGAEETFYDGEVELMSGGEPSEAAGDDDSTMFDVDVSPDPQGSSDTLMGYRAAVAYANELADELEEQGYECDRSWASQSNMYAIRCTQGSKSSNIEVNRDEMDEAITNNPRESTNTSYSDEAEWKQAAKDAGASKFSSKDGENGEQVTCAHVGDVVVGKWHKVLGSAEYGEIYTYDAPSDFGSDIEGVSEAAIRPTLHVADLHRDRAYKVDISVLRDIKATIEAGEDARAVLKKYSDQLTPTKGVEDADYFLDIDNGAESVSDWDDMDDDAWQVESADDDGPIEAYGQMGMKNKSWRKIFKNAAALNKWVDAHDAEVRGTRPAEGDSVDMDKSRKFMVKGEASTVGSIIDKALRGLADIGIVTNRLAVETFFLGGGSPPGGDRLLSDMVAAGFDDGATSYEENGEFYRSIGVTPEDFDALVAASAGEEPDADDDFGDMDESRRGARAKRALPSFKGYGGKPGPKGMLTAHGRTAKESSVVSYLEKYGLIVRCSPDGRKVNIVTPDDASHFKAHEAYLQLASSYPLGELKSTKLNDVDALEFSLA